MHLLPLDQKYHVVGNYSLELLAVYGKWKSLHIGLYYNLLEEISLYEENEGEVVFQAPIKHENI